MVIYPQMTQMDSDDVPVVDDKVAELPGDQVAGEPVAETSAAEDLPSKSATQQPSNPEEGNLATGQPGNLVPGNPATQQPSNPEEGNPATGQPGNPVLSNSATQQLSN